MIFYLKLFFLCSIVLSVGSVKNVNLQLNNGLISLQDEEIISVIVDKKNETKNNLTFVDSSMNNYTIEKNYNKFKTSSFNNEQINDHYEKFDNFVNQESDQFFNVVPIFNPAAGKVSKICRKQSNIYHRELKKMTLWALKMFDATGKIPSGILNGNVNQFGDFDECLGLQGTHGIRGKYCLAYLQLEIIDQSRDDLKYIHRLAHSHYAFRSNLTDPGHRVPRFGSIQFALCVPSACTTTDVETSLRATIDKFVSSTSLNVSVKVDQEMCQVQRYNKYPPETLIVGLFFIGMVILTIIAGICDHNNANISEILLAFSIKRNFKKLVSMKRIDGDIPTLHGVRAINAFMLIIAHKSMALFFNPYVNRTGMSEYLGQSWTVIGRAASLYTDPFIMLSGLLTSYSFVGSLKKNNSINIKKEYLSRLFRLLPTLAGLILFCTFIMPNVGSGPQWNLVVTHHADICKKTWWRSFLFIHNYYGFENMCLTHTHHLGIDTQLFAFSPLMVIALYNWPKLGTFVLIIIAIFSTALRYFITYYKHLNNYVYFGTSIRQLFDTANLSYILPSHRLTVYIIGIFIGFTLRKLPIDYKINKTIVKLGWILTTLMTLTAFVAPAGMGSINYVYDPTHAATYNAFAPIGWCALFAWVVFLSQTGNTHGWFSRFLSWKGFLISTRLSYAIYLTQFPVFFYNVGKTRSAEYFDFFKMMFDFHEFSWIIGTSVILTLLFDTPFQNIKNHLFKKRETTKYD